MTALPEVLEKLERATPGPWAWSVNGNIVPTPYTDIEIAAVYSEHDDDTIPANAEAIIAAVAWLRENGPALLRDAGDAKDAVRYRKLQAWYLSGAKMREIDPFGHIRPTTPEIIDAALDAMHAPATETPR